MTRPRTRRCAFALLLLCAAVAGGCGDRDERGAARGSIEPDAGGRSAATGAGRHLAAGCDLAGRLDAEVASLRERGIEPVHGGQPFVWSFTCAGGTLTMQVRATGELAGDGPSDEPFADPLLWLGAGGTPPLAVPVLLDAGAGQPQLRERLAGLAAGESATMRLDLATGVIWAEDDAGRRSVGVD